MAEQKKGKAELVLGGLLIAGAGGYLLWYLYRQAALTQLSQQIGFSVSYTPPAPSYHEQVEAKITLTNKSGKAMKVVVMGESYISGTQTRVGRFFADKNYALQASQAYEATGQLWADKPLEVTLGPGETKTRSMWSGQVGRASVVCGFSPCWVDIRWKVNGLVVRTDQRVHRLPD